jgi:hypothetical protein
MINLPNIEMMVMKIAMECIDIGCNSDPWGKKAGFG